MDEAIIKWDNLRRVLGEYGEALRNEYQDNLIRDGKIATGELLNSVEYTVEADDRSITLSLKLQDYYKWVEEGRQPGRFPPVDKILEWIRVKPILPDERNGKLPTEQQLAFLIGRKIAEEGIEGGHQLARARTTLAEEWEAKIDEAIALDVKDALDVIFSAWFSE